MAYDPFGSGDFGASPFDDIFARFFGGASPQRPPADRHRPAADRAGPRGNQGRRYPGRPVGRPRPRHRPPAVGGHQAGAGPPPAERGGRGPGRHRQADRVPGRARPAPRRDAKPDPGGQAGAARRAADLPGARLVLHRPRAPAVRAGRQPGIGRGPGARRSPGHPGGAARRGHGAAAAAAGAGAKPPSDTPTVDEFGTDLTAMAREDRIDPVVGREQEIEQTVEVLSRRTKNNPVLIGEPGVGQDRDRRGHRAADRRRGRAGHAARQAPRPARPRRHGRRAPGTGATSRSG